MSEKPINVGIIGAGSNTREKHIPGLQAQPNVNIVGVVNRSRLSSQKAANDFGIPRVFDHWRELVESDTVDAVVIGTWPYLHAPATLAALAAGKHVMVEARMAMNLAEARAMFAAAQAAPHLVAQIVPSPFTLHLDATLQRMIAAGYLGDLLAIEVRAHGGAFVDRESPLNWRQDIALSGLNVMMMGIWYEALMRWVGPAERVMAMGQVNVPLRHDANGKPRAVQIPDHLSVLAQMACSAQAALHFSAVTGLHAETGAWLHGSEGTLRISEGRLYGGQRGDDSLSEIAIPDSERGGWRVEEEFVNAIRGLEPITHTSFADGLRYMAFTEAVHQSMRTGAAVPVPLS